MIMPACSKGGGTAACFPDVCKTPAPPAPFAPIPYPNIAQCSQAKGCSKVKIKGKQAVTVKSAINMSSGDEGGAAGGGMISSKMKGPAEYKMGSSKVKFKGKKAAHLLSMVGQNGKANHNMPAGTHVAPSQTKVKVMP